MQGKEEDVSFGANKFPERQPIDTAAQSDEKDYKEPAPAPLFEPGELKSWSFYRAVIAEFLATFLFLYISILTVMGVVSSKSKCSTVGIQGIAWAFGGMIFALVYTTAGISGRHINLVVTFGLFLARKLSLTRALFYMVMQCLGAICGAGIVKGFKKSIYMANNGSTNSVSLGYTKGGNLGAEIIGTFVLVYTIFSATGAKRNARDSHDCRQIASQGCHDFLHYLPRFSASKKTNKFVILLGISTIFSYLSHHFQLTGVKPYIELDCFFQYTFLCSDNFSLPGRYGLPEEVAGLEDFLALSPAASYITG